MRAIPTYIHGILDYIVGIALLLAPFIFGFYPAGGPAVWIPILLGIGVIAMALLTRFEVGLIRVIPMRVHLGVDYVAGIFLAASPFLFGFVDLPWNAWVPHLLVGLAVLIVALFTNPIPTEVHERRFAH